MAREKKEKPPKKEKAPKIKKERASKVKKEKDEETLLQKLMRQAKIKGAEEEVPEETAEAAEGQEEASGGNKRKKLILLIAAAVLVLVAVAVVVIFVILPRLSGGEGEPEPSEEPSPEPVLYDLPASFEVGEETVAGLVPLLPDGVQAEKDPRVRYTYTGMTDAGAEAEAYAATLRGEGFSVVDEEFVRTEAPDYSTLEGTVLLAKNMPKKAAEADAEASASPAPSDASASPSESESPSPSESESPSESVPPSGSPSDAPAEEEKDMVLTVDLTWAEGTLTVTCDQAEGRVTSPNMPGSGMTPGASMSMWEAEDFLRGLEPSVLGLEGDSMENYHIYAIDGAVLVNGQPCMRLNIYSREEGQSNEVAGIYLMSRDGQHLYLLDEEAKSVKELPLP